MRKILELSLLKLMENDNNIVLLTADDESNELTMIEKRFPERFIRVGIAECNLVGIAAGISRTGLIPIVYTYGAFIVHRAYDFLRCDVCINNLNVKLIGWGSGVKVNNYGASHHTTEDISMLRVLPNLNLFSPASPFEVESILEEAVYLKGPVYIRLGKSFENEIFETKERFIIGKSKVIKEGCHVTVISTGNIISNVIEASKELEKENLHVEIINLSSIKPLDIQTIVNSIEKTKNVITVEEHQINGGIGSAVAEIIAERNLTCHFKRLGFQDKFVTEFGWHKDLLEFNGLSVTDLINQIRDINK